MTASSQEQQDYRATLNLPLADRDSGAFPQRGNLPAREPVWQQQWLQNNLYQQSLQKPAPRGIWTLHDGPPYSNGNIHLGHALNKITKDIVTRYRTMAGYRSPYVPGFDNHGMPIENAVARRFREEKKTPSRVELRKACRAWAEEWVGIQSEQFQRLGIRGDWQHPYLTMSSEFEARIVEVFGELVQKGFIYRGLKPVFWCASCETALADAEVEYEPHTSNSIYVRFPLHHDPAGMLAAADAPCYAVIWTTTPWTIPANLAIAVHPEAEYVLVHAEKEGEACCLLMAEPLRESVLNACGFTNANTLAAFQGSQLEGLTFQHPLFQRTAPILTAAYVTMDAGTGLVHTAPGHGKEDFETGMRYGLEVLNPVDASGRYTAQAGSWNGSSFEGLRVIPDVERKEKDAPANIVLLQALRESGNLLAASKYEHSYPHCWRCHSPLVFRATVQWFMNIDHNGFREQALGIIQQVRWYPPESINRIHSMVSGRPDWCISRQRSWGVGIPAFYCTACGEHILTPESIAAVADLTRRESNDAWYERTPEEILPQGFCCPHCKQGVERIKKETDVLDVWFDSGSSHRAVLGSENPWGNMDWPADLYLEGGDQHRGWFNSSLMIAAATRGAAPYRAVVTNGWSLDENGEAMHKSKGNVVDPGKVVAQYGADVVRWWVASQEFMADTRCGDTLLKQVSDMYRRVRNTFRFLLNNLADFDPQTMCVPRSEMEELDRWALGRFDQLAAACTAAYENYEHHRIYQETLNFCSTDLSSFYLDVIKDRLYASAKNSHLRRSGQTALYQLAAGMARLLAPILVHTAEEVWSHLPGEKEAWSIHLASLPEPQPQEEGLQQSWNALLQVRDAANKALETARQGGQIGNPLECCLEIAPDADSADLLGKYESMLPTLLLVSQVVLLPAEQQMRFAARAADGSKCARCWLIRTDTGHDSRHPALCMRCVEAIET